MASSPVRRVNRQSLLTHLRVLQGERHPYTSRAHLEAAQAYVASQWWQWGLQVVPDEFSHQGERFANLIARPIACPPGPRLILGAHLDTVPGSPGADDNSSGVAALLEIARLTALSAQPLPIEFAAFALEELGLLGSSHDAAGLRRNGAALIGMLSLEMIGFTESEGLQHYPWFLRGRFPASGTYIGLAANRCSSPLLKTVDRAMRGISGLPVETLVVPGNGWAVPEIRLSDHAPFWDRGYPALLVTDTAFFRNPHYHQASDTVETLALDFLERVTQGLVAAVEALTKASPTAPLPLNREACLPP